MKNNNQGFKRVFIGIMVMLLVWNGFLTYQMSELRNNKTTVTDEGKVVEKVVTELDTDLTKVVEETHDKVVTVTNSVGNKEQGSGSGVVYANKNGVTQIITNHHVVEGGNSFKVKVASGEEYQATLKGSDPFTDLALLEVSDDMNIEPIKIGDSSTSKVGEFVVAIGSPVDKAFANSVTFGIISGKDRLVPVDLNSDGQPDWEMVVTQTDAAINPGNSGGALVNMAGELVGINSMKLASSEIEGMGFSIPVNEVVPIIKQLEETGKVQYPIVGLSAKSLSDMNEFEKAYYKLDTDSKTGVFVMEVTSDGPARAAGVKPGDVITHFDGNEVENFKLFRRMLYGKKVGDTAKLSIDRYGESMEIEVILK